MIARAKKLTPQAALVLRHFMRGQNLTASQAVSVYGIARLAARIKELRDAGHKVQTTMVHVGAGKHHGRYELKSLRWNSKS